MLFLDTWNDYRVYKNSEGNLELYKGTKNRVKISAGDTKEIERVVTNVKTIAELPDFFFKKYPPPRKNQKPADNPNQCRIF